MAGVYILMKIDGLIEGKIINRPSKYIKSPYVADILYNNEAVLGHTASLGCCGLANASSIILMTPTKSTSINPKCTHTVYLSLLQNGEHEQIIGIHPKLAEKLTETALKSNLLTSLQNIKSYRRETGVYIKDKINSRFDFTGVDQYGIPFIMEVKNVPLADYEDVSAKERTTRREEFSNRDVNSKVAYFPDGYRKKISDTVSPRALKHIRELTLIKTDLIESSNNIRCIMCYVIQRNDVNRFQPSIIDPEYRAAFIDAVNAGVEIITMVVSWNRNGEAIFIRDNLPISIL